LPRGALRTAHPPELRICENSLWDSERWVVEQVKRLDANLEPEPLEPEIN
jgi:hypothetical protein